MIRVDPPYGLVGVGCAGGGWGRFAPNLRPHAPTAPLVETRALAAMGTQIRQTVAGTCLAGLLLLVPAASRAEEAVPVPDAELLEFLADWKGAEAWLDERLEEAVSRKETREAMGVETGSKEGRDETR